MNTSILKDMIGHLCDWKAELESGPSGPEWEAECKACSVALSALVGERTRRQLAYAKDQAYAKACEEQAAEAAEFDYHNNKDFS